MLALFVADAMGLFQDNIDMANAERHQQTIQQQLDGPEADTWKSVTELEANKRALQIRMEERPGDYKRHLQFLVYALVLGLQDVMAVRMEFFYKCAICQPEESQQHDICLVIDMISSTLYFVFNRYKTSAHHGSYKVEVPHDLSLILRMSVSVFPRNYLFTHQKNIFVPMSDKTASQFIQNSWVLPGTGPTATNLRSAIATRFFRLHSAHLPRAEFAFRSGVTVDRMFQSYVKFEDGDFLT